MKNLKNLFVIFILLIGFLMVGCSDNPMNVNESFNKNANSLNISQNKTIESDSLIYSCDSLWYVNGQGFGDAGAIWEFNDGGSTPLYKMIRIEFHSRFLNGEWGSDCFLQSQMIQRHDRMVYDTLSYEYKIGKSSSEDFSATFNVPQYSGQWGLLYDFHIRNNTIFLLYVTGLKVYRVK